MCGYILAQFTSSPVLIVHIIMRADATLKYAYSHLQLLYY